MNKHSSDATAVPRCLNYAARSSMFAYSIAAVAIPVSLISINGEMGFTLTQAGSLSFWGSLSQFGTLLTSIPLAMVLGKINSLRSAIWLLALGMLLFTGITGYLHAVLIVLLISIASGVLEGMLTPLMEDMHPSDNGSQQLLLHSFWPVGTVFGALIIGELLSRGINWRFQFAGIALLCFLAGWLYPSAKRIRLPKSRTDFSHMGDILGKTCFWRMGLALFFAGGTEGGFAFWMASYIQIEFAVAARAGTIGLTIFALGMTISRFFSSRLILYFTLSHILISAVIVNLISGLLLYLAPNLPVLYILCGLFGMSIAPLWPGVQTWTMRIMNVDATITMIFLSCLGVIGYSSSSFVIGILGDKFGLRNSLLMLPFTAALLLVLLSFVSRSVESTG